MRKLVKLLPQLRFDTRSIRRLIVAQIKRVLATNLTFLFIATSFLPNSGGAILQNNLEDSPAIEVQIPTAIVNATQYPLAEIRVSQRFSFFHPGVDFAAPYGKEVLPIRKGVVKEAGYSPLGYGYMVLLDHGNETTSLYAHLSKILVKKDAEVDLTTTLGEIGSTGHSTGPHLHLEISTSGKFVNPLIFLPLPPSSTE